MHKSLLIRGSYGDAHDHAGQIVYAAANSSQNVELIVFSYIPYEDDFEIK